MRLSCRVEGSACGALLTTTTRSHVVRQPPSGRRGISGKKATSRKGREAEAQRAFSCPRSSLWLLSTFAPTTEIRHRSQRTWSRDGLFSYSTAAAAVANTTPRANLDVPKQDRETLMRFVGQPAGGSVDE